MTLPTSGAIDFGQIRTELGGSGPISIADLNTRIAAGKLTAGSAVDMTDFYKVKIYTVTVGQSGAGTSWGWSSAGTPYGSISPVEYQGFSIDRLGFAGGGGGIGNNFSGGFVWGFGGNPVPPTRITNYRSHNALTSVSNDDAMYNAGGGQLFDASNIGGVYKVAVKEQ